jgi:hypothetical protein
MTRIFTEAHRAKLREAARLRAAREPRPAAFTFRGRTHSEATKAKIAESNRRRAARDRGETTEGKPL